METLILHKRLSEGYDLKDASNNRIGFFKTVEAAQKWCSENGYRLRVQNPGKAVKLYRRFNRREPTRTVSRNISLRGPLVDLGACVAVAYASRKEGKLRHYEHKCGPGARLLCTADGQTLIVVGSTLRVTDWIRG